MTTATIPDGRIGKLASNAKCANCMVPIPRDTNAWIAYTGGSITCLSCVGGGPATTAAEPATATPVAAPAARTDDPLPPSAPTATKAPEPRPEQRAAPPATPAPAPAESTSDDVQRLERRAADADRQIAQLTKELAAARAAAEEQQAELARTLPATRTAADRQIAELTTELMAIRTAAEEQIAERDRRINELDQQLSANSADDTKTNERLAAASAQLAEMRDRQRALADDLAVAQGERDRIADELADIHAAQAAAAAQAASTKNLDRTVVIGTGVVLVAVAVLTYVGGVFSAVRYAGWQPAMAALVPLCIEAGAAVELASLVRDRRRGRQSHWSAKLLATGLLGMSITAMILHATDAPAGAHRWWAYVIACGLPLELAALVRAALGGDHTAPKTRKARQT